MKFVDANYFLRFFLNDNHRQHLVASALFAKASLGKANLCTDLIVIFEVYWVLKKYYGAKHVFVKQTIEDICHMDFVVLSERSLLNIAITNLASFNYDLEDSYHFFFAQSQKAKEFATFDKKIKNKFTLFLKNS